MNTNPLLFALIVAMALAVGCHRESGGGTQTIKKQNVRTYTKAELDKLIVFGMSAAEITNKFGPPGSLAEINEGVVLFTYSFPIEPEQEALHLAGFDIYVKDGNVARWSPIMGESRKTFDAGGSQGSFGEQSFQIFLATDSQSNLVNAVDLQGSADASGLKTSADMAFKAKVFAGNSGSERPGEQTVILVLSDRDVSILKPLTEDNFGKRLLIVCRSKVIAAPIISAPLASSQLMFRIKDSGLDSLRSR